VRATAVATLVLVLFSAAVAAPAQGADGGRVSLRWAFIRLEKGVQGRVVEFSPPPVVRAGERLQVYLEPLSRIHLYLYLFDSSRDLALLYPPAVRAPPASAGERLLLPGEGQWFTIDERAGEEQFYLLASATRLSRLEDLTSSWLRKPADPEAKARVLDEIKDLRRRHSSLAAAVEKAIPMAGTFQTRALTEDILGDATVVEAAGFYARTLRLKHE
jgi:hypothetical protein